MENGGGDTDIVAGSTMPEEKNSLDSNKERIEVMEDELNESNDLNHPEDLHKKDDQEKEEEDIHSLANMKIDENGITSDHSSDNLTEEINGLTTDEDEEARTSPSDEEDKEMEELKGKFAEVSSVHERLKVDYNKLKQEYFNAKNKIQTQEEQAQKELTNIKNEYNKAIKTLKEKCDAANKEKSASVMNFARREKEVMDANKKVVELDKKYRAAHIERDKLSHEVKNMSAELGKLKSILAKKEKDVKFLQTKIDVVKEDASSHNIKIKWAQNKLKCEVDAHSETKEKLSKALGSIKQANEETEQIRKNCQEMIKTYQESEEIKSNSLDSQLKETRDLLHKEKSCVKSLEEDLTKKMEELEMTLQEKQKIQEEFDSLKKIEKAFETENKELEKKNQRYEGTLNEQKAKIGDQNSKLQVLLELELELETAKEEINRLTDASASDAELVKQSNSDKDSWKQKEQELLDFTMKLTTKNAELGSECENYKTKLSSVETNLLENSQLLEQFKSECNELKAKIEKLEKDSSQNSNLYNKELQDRDKSICDLTIKLEEKSDEIRTIKRKNTARMKDLTRQLQQYKKDMKNDNSDHSQNGDSTMENGLGSRVGSCSSLDVIDSGMHDSSSTVSSNNSVDNHHSSVPETVISTPFAVNHSVLVERIVRLQNIHARKNEKIDFLQDHITRLTEKLKRQSRLVQHYMLREESGMLSPPIEHFEKSSRRLTLEFSIEINRKMQAVLEDTILKNIALKESVDALGAEIARLSIKTSTS